MSQQRANVMQAQLSELSAGSDDLSAGKVNLSGCGTTLPQPAAEAATAAIARQSWPHAHHVVLPHAHHVVRPHPADARAEAQQWDEMITRLRSKHIDQLPIDVARTQASGWCVQAVGRHKSEVQVKVGCHGGAASTCFY